MSELVDDLERLAALLEKGLITREQFDQQRDALMAGGAGDTVPPRTDEALSLEETPAPPSSAAPESATPPVPGPTKSGSGAGRRAVLILGTAAALVVGIGFCTSLVLKHHLNMPYLPQVIVDSIRGKTLVPGRTTTDEIVAMGFGEATYETPPDTISTRTLARIMGIPAPPWCELDSTISEGQLSFRFFAEEEGRKCLHLEKVLFTWEVADSAKDGAIHAARELRDRLGDTWEIEGSPNYTVRLTWQSSQQLTASIEVATSSIDYGISRLMDVAGF